MKIRILEIEIEDIKPSPTNPRKHFDESALVELAENIKQHGLISPLIVRQMGVEYELVCGERRLRACRILGLKKVPCRDIALSDNDALELQLVENLQRVDLTALEEAESLNKMLSIQKNGKAIWSTEKLASRLGKSASYIVKRVALVRIPNVAREALVSGKISASTASIIGRIPSQRLREKAANEICKAGGADVQLNHREAESLVRERYCKLISKIVDHDKVYGEFPSCINCPNRSGNMTDFVGRGENVCTDTACLENKQRLAWDDVMSSWEKSGRKCLDYSDSLELFDNRNLKPNSAMVGLYDRIDDSLIKPEVVANRDIFTWDEVLMGTQIEVMGAFNGECAVSILKYDVALAAAKQAKPHLFKDCVIAKEEKPKDVFDTDKNAREKQAVNLKSAHVKALRLLIKAIDKCCDDSVPQTAYAGLDICAEYHATVSAVELVCKAYDYDPKEEEDICDIISELYALEQTKNQSLLIALLCADALRGHEPNDCDIYCELCELFDVVLTD